MSVLTKLFSSGAAKLVETVGNAIDNNITNAEEKLQIKKELQGQILDFTSKTVSEATSIINTEAAGNWLQRSWRPLVMLSFAFIIIYRYFLSQVFGWPTIDLPDTFWSLLEIGLGGYVIGRSAEKVTSTLVDKIDVIPSKLKRKREE